MQDMGVRPHESDRDARKNWKKKNREMTAQAAENAINEGVEKALKDMEGKWL